VYIYIFLQREIMDNEEDNQNIQDHLQDDVIKEALASGLDLREYSKKVGLHRGVPLLAQSLVPQRFFLFVGRYGL
jgi:hypothetical protein